MTFHQASTPPWAKRKAQDYLGRLAEDCDTLKQYQPDTDE